MERVRAERDEGVPDSERQASKKPLGSRATAEQLAKILNSVPHVIWSATPDGKLDFVSEQWTYAYGGETSQLVGEGWVSFVHPDDVQEAVSRWHRALLDGEPYEIEFRLRIVSDEYRWVLVTARPEKDAAGKIQRWIGTCTDIHGRIIAQQALAA